VIIFIIYHNIGSHTYLYKTTPMEQNIWEDHGSSVSHEFSVWHPACFFKIHFNIISHLQVGIPSGFYHKTNPAHFSTNAFHLGCHVCDHISNTSYIKESSKYTVSLFVRRRFLQDDCTVTSHNLANVRIKHSAGDVKGKVLPANGPEW